jgi:hypothetical protein
MKAQIYSIFLASLCVGCQSDPTSKNPDIQKLSSQSIKIMNKAAVNTCNCLEKHEASLVTFLDNQEKILGNIPSGQEIENTFRALIENSKNTKEYNECMKSAQLGADDTEKNVLKNDMIKILGDASDQRSMAKKRQEMMLAFVEKNCKSRLHLIQKYIKQSEEVQNLRKQLINEEQKKVYEANPIDLCNCADLTLKVLQESEKAMQDKDKLKLIEEKYSKDLDACEKYRQFRSAEAQKSFMEELKKCPSSQEIEKIIRAKTAKKLK